MSVFPVGRDSVSINFKTKRSGLGQDKQSISFGDTSDPAYFCALKSAVLESQARNNICRDFAVDEGAILESSCTDGHCLKTPINESLALYGHQVEIGTINLLWKPKRNVQFCDLRNGPQCDDGWLVGLGSIFAGAADYIPIFGAAFRNVGHNQHHQRIGVELRLLSRHVGQQCQSTDGLCLGWIAKQLSSVLEPLGEVVSGTHSKRGECREGGQTSNRDCRCADHKIQSRLFSKPELGRPIPVWNSVSQPHDQGANKQAEHHIGADAVAAIPQVPIPFVRFAMQCTEPTTGIDCQVERFSIKRLGNMVAS